MFDIDQVDESKEGQVLMNKVSAHHEMSRMVVDDQGIYCKKPGTTRRHGRKKQNEPGISRETIIDNHGRIY